MTFSNVWFQGWMRVLNHFYATDDFAGILEEIEQEAITTCDHDPELSAIYNAAALAKALRDFAERENLRTREMVRAINSAVAAATWALDDINKWAFRMTKDPDTGRWVAHGIPFDELKKGAHK